MAKLLKILLVIVAGFGLLLNQASAATKTAPEITVGILAPVAIPAMEEIVKGFEQELNQLYPGKINYLVKNAQGDLNFQRAILQQFKAQNVSLVVPIGTNVAQMADKINTTQPIVALAANFTTADRDKFNNKNITNILDEVDVQQQIDFIHSAFPSSKKITLIYSPDDRIFLKVNQASVTAAKYGMQIQKLMIQTLPDLYTVSQQIDHDSQAIFILKDEMIVSGINTLIKQAAQKNILLIASDDGSVQKGADLAVGVSERAIGTGGAHLAAKVLSGTAPSAIPVTVMTDYQIFVTPQYKNDHSLAQGLRFAQLPAAAEKFKYPIITLKQRQD